MANEFDPYREALVMEAVTIWPEEYDDWEPAERRRIEEQLHSDPAQAAEMVYVRSTPAFDDKSPSRRPTSNDWANARSGHVPAASCFAPLRAKRDVKLFSAGKQPA